ncbi:MAG: HlyD family efflux transporter periplasmic adaptor subunit [Phycisphaerales bacterium]
MIDLSSLKTPGWQRILAELHAPAPDDRTFLLRLVAVLAQVSGARQAVLFAVDRAESEDAATALGEPRPVLVWPPAGDGSATSEIEYATDARAAAREAAGGAQVRVFGLEAGSAGAGFYSEDREKGYIIAVPVQQGSPEAGPAGPRGVVTLLVEPRSKQALQTTVAMAEVLAGYTQLHAVRQTLRRTKAASAALDLAARLIASVNTGSTFKGASLQLVNDLSRQVRADRVALGWVKGIASSGAVRVVAVSDTEHVDRRMAMVQKLEAAMDECLDQEQAVMHPPPPAGEGGDVVLAQAITHAHRDLCAADVRMKVVSLPLRQDDKVIGVVTVESTAEGPADVASVELLQAALDLVAPVMMLRRSDDQPLAKRAWTSTLKTGAWLVGPRHTAWKLAALALLLLAIFVTFFSMPYRVEATAELQPRVRHIVSAPIDGIIATLGEGIEPGRTVRKGDVLATMNTDELRLQLLHAQQEHSQYNTEEDGYLQARPPRLSEAYQARARALQAKAKADLAQLNLDRATIVSPIDGVIIAGDLADKVGASVKMGDGMFQIAPLDDIVVIARVSDRDIALIRGPGDEGGATKGEVATKADPSLAFGFVVERIVPLAQSKDGQNTFEVRGKLAGAGPRLRPGMEGVAKLDTGRHSLLWIGTRRIRDQLRLWLWW